jgi:hypothetical protein
MVSFVGDDETIAVANHRTHAQLGYAAFDAAV